MRYEFCWYLSFYVLSQFDFLSFVTVGFFKTLTQFEFLSLSKFEFLIFITIWLWSKFKFLNFLTIWLWSQFEFCCWCIFSLSFVTIWVLVLSQFEFLSCLKLSFELSQFYFLSFVPFSVIFLFGKQNSEVHCMGKKCSVVQWIKCRPLLCCRVHSSPTLINQIPQTRKNPCIFPSVYVLLLAWVERFDVLRMQDFWLSHLSKN